jgi:hypothetical protein
MKDTPCDWGECPYDAFSNEHCRWYCGLGVDEDSYPEEDYDAEFYEDEDCQ